MIIDTNALSVILGNDSAGRRAIAGKIAGHRQFCLPVIVLGEYEFGLRGSRECARLTEALNRFMLLCDMLIVSKTTAAHYADIAHFLKKSGRPIPHNDVWIAALAREHGLPILSEDRHFDTVPGVRRIGWLA